MYIDADYIDSVIRIMSKIVEIKTETGYTTDQILMAMLIAAIDRK